MREGGPTEGMPSCVHWVRNTFAISSAHKVLVRNTYCGCLEAAAKKQGSHRLFSALSSPARSAIVGTRLRGCERWPRREQSCGREPSAATTDFGQYQYVKTTPLLLFCRALSDHSSPPVSVSRLSRFAVILSGALTPCLASVSALRQASCALISSNKALLP